MMETMINYDQFQIKGIMETMINHDQFLDQRHDGNHDQPRIQRYKFLALRHDYR